MQKSTLISYMAAIQLLNFAPVVQAAPPKALPGAHAHNDYYHKRPLFDALERGFVSIEADLFLVDGELRVGHYAHELRPERTLESLYLRPLRGHIANNGGRVFQDEERLTLLVDFKTDGEAAYAVLRELLEKYDDIVSKVDGDAIEHRAVDVIVTGDRPIQFIASDKRRRVAIDGRLADLKGDRRPELMPLVSENWASHFSWRGNGPMPDDQRRTLRDIVDLVEDSGRRLRFWGTPDDPAVWRELRDAGVHVIGTDDLDALRKFLTSP